jgi:hypothetical protein
LLLRVLVCAFALLCRSFCHPRFRPRMMHPPSAVISPSGEAGSLGYSWRLHLLHRDIITIFSTSCYPTFIVICSLWLEAHTLVPSMLDESWGALGQYIRGRGSCLGMLGVRRPLMSTSPHLLPGPASSNFLLHIRQPQPRSRLVPVHHHLHVDLMPKPCHASRRS